MSESAWFGFITLWLVLFAGSPDLVDRLGMSFEQEQCESIKKGE